MSTEVDSPNRSGCRTPVEQMSGLFSPACVDRFRVKRLLNSGLDPNTEPCLPGDISVLSSRLTKFQIEASIQRAKQFGFTEEQLFGPNGHRLLNEMDFAPRARHPRIRPDGTKDYSRRVVTRSKFPSDDECLAPIQPAPKPGCVTTEAPPEEASPVFAKPASKKRGGKIPNGPKRKTRVTRSTYKTNKSRPSGGTSDGEDNSAAMEDSVDYPWL
ncbi:hypothetical protein DSO57_1013472 [Entomophthora muscae]|uniref:Uncharacterized protein n=1 Tax=Entomophthora muscae TaxID=34485 RepID=A0ACC2U4U2_9FUNG|nr:hypothetical protein DSO57_1013472 [Entomophthora muscae]